MSPQLKQIEAAARSLKLKLPFTPECDPAHDLIDRIIVLCSQSAQDTDPALEALCRQHEGVVGASVTRYQLDDRWLAIGIPRHQPFGQQVGWCDRKGATSIEVVIEIHSDEKRTQLYQTNSIKDFKK